MHVYANYYKKIYFFSLLYTRRNRNSTNFENKNIKKSEFYNKDIKYLI